MLHKRYLNKFSNYDCTVLMKADPDINSRWREMISGASQEAASTAAMLTAEPEYMKAKTAPLGFPSCSFRLH